MRAKAIIIIMGCLAGCGGPPFFEAPTTEDAGQIAVDEQATPDAGADAVVRPEAALADASTPIDASPDTEAEDARADAGARYDAPLGTGLCCRSEDGAGLLTYTPAPPTLATNDPCYATGHAGVVVECPDGAP